MSCPATSSGVKAVGTSVVLASPGKIRGVTLIGGSAASTVTVYDSASAASGTVLEKLSAPISGFSKSETCIVANNGIVVVVAGAAAEAIVHYEMG